LKSESKFRDENIQAPKNLPALDIAAKVNPGTGVTVKGAYLRVVNL
jgi:hypothetical protein